MGDRVYNLFPMLYEHLISLMWSHALQNYEDLIASIPNACESIGLYRYYFTFPWILEARISCLHNIVMTISFYINYRVRILQDSARMIRKQNINQPIKALLTIASRVCWPNRKYNSHINFFYSKNKHPMSMKLFVHIDFMKKWNKLPLCWNIQTIFDRHGWCKFLKFLCKLICKSQYKV